MSAPAGEKEARSSTGPELASLGSLNSLWQAQRFDQARKVLSLVLFVSAGALWILSLGKWGASLEGLPWYLSVAVFSVLSVRFLRAETSFELLGLPRSKEPVSLPETLSICFLLLAACLYSSVAYMLLHPPLPLKTTQIVDIQLLSERDFSDEASLLPGSEPQEDLKKRSADQVSQRGSLEQNKLVKANLPSEQRPKSRQNQIKAKNSNGKAQVERVAENSAPEESSPSRRELTFENSNAAPLMIPNGWQTKTVDKPFVTAAARASSPSKSAELQPFISEVAPPELVELIENDGEQNAMHVFQKGGKSSGGKGAENSLSQYLKELHRKIKSAWSPPRGSTRTVDVLFRLKKDGKLAFVKIKKASGEEEIDSSAAKAVMTATAKAGPLPKDYSHDYLDVIYTFNYNVNELKEVSGAEFRQAED
ncbi:MAG: TonB C-terminal domain-containing protein [Candidatus Obscuribacterales bacterium]|nr:TonB C-terminal domain-containing protein [Candidatus Obscuribacterales bacterium]